MVKTAMLHYYCGLLVTVIDWPHALILHILSQHMHPFSFVFLLQHRLQLRCLVIHAKQAASVQKEHLPAIPLVWLLLHLLQ